MTSSSRLRRRTGIALATAGILSLVACSDSRLRALDAGISKDSVLKIISAGAPAGDSLPNLYKQTQYFVDGKMFDIYFFEPKGRKIWKDPEVSDKELTPIVLIDGKFDGSGWTYMDGLSEKYKIPGRAGAK